MFFSPRKAAALLLLAAAACKTTEPRHVDACPAPLEFVAWICADAARTELAGSDPLPYHAMAPATRCEDGSWLVRYDRRSDGRWAARAQGRLLATSDPSAAFLPQHARYEADHGLRGWRKPDGMLEVRILPTGVECTLHRVAGANEAESALRHVREAVAFASRLADPDSDDPRPCCAAHAPWRALSRLRAASHARAAGDLVTARSALARAFADAPFDRSLGLAIASLDRELGQDELAAASLAAVSILAADPFVRTDSHRGAVEARTRLENGIGDSLRAAAAGRLQQGKLRTAHSLLLAARSTAPDNIADLSLRHRLQTELRDDRGALGTALLLREYGAGPDGDRLLSASLSMTGQQALARRALVRADLADAAAGQPPMSPYRQTLLAEAIRRITEPQPAAPGR